MGWLLVRPWAAKAIKRDLNQGELNHSSDMLRTKALMQIGNIKSETPSFILIYNIQRDSGQYKKI